MNNELTVQNMILMLPFDREYKTNLLQTLATLDSERAVSVESIIRDLYQGVFSLHYEQNLQHALREVTPDIEINDEFYAKIKEATRVGLMQQLNTPDTTQLNLIGTREKLQQVMADKQ